MNGGMYFRVHAMCMRHPTHPPITSHRELVSATPHDGLRSQGNPDRRLTDIGWRPRPAFNRLRYRGRAAALAYPRTKKLCGPRLVRDAVDGAWMLRRLAVAFPYDDGTPSPQRVPWSGELRSARDARLDARLGAAEGGWLAAGSTLLSAHSRSPSSARHPAAVRRSGRSNWTSGWAEAGGAYLTCCSASAADRIEAQVCGDLRSEGLHTGCVRPANTSQPSSTRTGG